MKVSKVGRALPDQRKTDRAAGGTFRHDSSMKCLCLGPAAAFRAFLTWFPEPYWEGAVIWIVLSLHRSFEVKLLTFIHHMRAV